MGLHLFKLELEIMGVNTYNRSDLVERLYKLYLKTDKSAYRKAIGSILKVSC